jgi:hypothetical protein
LQQLRLFGRRASRGEESGPEAAGGRALNSPDQQLQRQSFFFVAFVTFRPS